MKKIKKIMEKKNCPFCGHTRAINKFGEIVSGHFCSRCGKENKGFKVIINKHKKEKLVAVI